MSESPQSGVRNPVLQAEDSAAALALRSLSVLTQNAARQAETLDADFVDALHTAALDPQSGSFLPILDALHAAHVSNAQIADLYLPAVARKLGAEWSDDNKTFSEVTIGVARLQRLLHDLGPEWRADTVQRFDAPTVLVLTGPKADHTFGARIILGQLRRRGLSVRLALGLRPDQIKALMGTAHFDAVMISASLTEDLGALRTLIEAVRSSSSPSPPIVLGGSVCALSVDVKAKTGADFLTSEIEDAIRFCALDTATKDHPHTPEKS